MTERLSGALQENLLTILSFSDANAVIVRNSIEAELFEGHYYSVASRAYDYIDKYEEAPKEHIADLFDDIFEGKDSSKANIFEGILRSLHENAEDVNEEYAMNQMHKFIRQQYLKQGVYRAAELLQQGTEVSLDQAEVELNKALERRIISFDPGTYLTNTERSLDFLNTEDFSFPTGIKEFDRLNLGPARGEIHVLIALAKAGKTWWLLNLARQALLQNYKVCHITLEMSEAKMSQRYVQNLFAIPKRPGVYKHQEFELDSLQRVMGLKEIDVDRRLSLEDPHIKKHLTGRINEFGTKLKRMVIKQFPMHTLTIPQLKAYLDTLEMTERFVPDLLIMDYPDLMFWEDRLQLGAIYKALRGIGVERNIGIAAVTQSNRGGVKSKTIDMDNVAEDFSKIATADCVMTYNQTDEEHALGLARLHVSNARNDADRFSVIVSQDYALGQFFFDSALMTSSYEGLLAPPME